VPTRRDCPPRRARHALLVACGLAVTVATATACHASAAPQPGTAPGSGPAPRSAPARASSAPAPCATAGARARLSSAVAHAEGRFNLEVTGSAAHTQLIRVAQDATFLAALRSGQYAAALAEANSQLTHHVVRIRVSRGSRLLVDANPSSFSVNGPTLELRQHNGSALGLLRITIQDVLGFVKLVHKFTHSELLVRGRRGAVVTSLPALANRSLPAYGCVSAGGATYLARSFGQLSFTGDPVTVWVLVAA
jgi:hypothetical protein